MILVVSLLPALLVGFALSGFEGPVTDIGWMRSQMPLLRVLASLTLLARSSALLQRFSARCFAQFERNPTHGDVPID